MLLTTILFLKINSKHSWLLLKAPGLKDLADRLGDKLDTRVSITMGKAKGKVIIEFSTLEDLRRIVDVIEKN